MCFWLVVLVLVLHQLHVVGIYTQRSKFNGKTFEIKFNVFERRAVATDTSCAKHQRRLYNNEIQPLRKQDARSGVHTGLKSKQRTLSLTGNQNLARALWISKLWI